MQKGRHAKTPTSESAKNRLMRHCIVPEEESACWGWRASKKQSGYGRIRIDSVEYIASRLSFAVHKEDPGDLDVMHTCDNPECCNPEHLTLGSHQENIRDAVTKGRWKGKGRGCSRNAGARNPMAKLSERDRDVAIEMILSLVPHKEIAEKVGASLSAIRCISMREKRRRAPSALNLG